MLKRQIERYGRWLIAIGFLMGVAVVSGGYIVVQQRLRTPLQERYEIRAEFSTSSGLTPGLGQAVNVAGVRVGTITDSELRNGRAVISLQIDPAKLPPAKVRRNASAALVPNTPLKDMQVELFPGRPPAPRLPEGGMVPVARTEPPIDSDELTSALDADTRAFFELLVAGGADATRGRGRDLRALFKAIGPTTSQLRQVGDALAARRDELRRLVHNLRVLAQAVGEKDRELVRVVEAADATLHAIGGEEAALRASLRRLPGTLQDARTSLGHATAFADELAPTLTRLTPAARRLPAALRAATPLLDEAEPILRTRVRPLVRDLQPLAADLAPTTRDLSAVTPSLTTAFSVLNYVANELVYNPDGDNEGFLYWLAWFAHNGASALSTEDAHGAAIRGLALVSCDTLVQQPGIAPLLETLTGVLPICQPPS